MISHHHYYHHYHHSENVDKDGKCDNVPSQTINVSKQTPAKTVANKKETAAKSKKASKGRKQKVVSV